MRKKREYPPVDEPFTISEDGGAMTQTDCLNRIYVKVNLEGPTKDVVQGLRGDIDYICERYNIDDQCVILLAAILEESSSNGMDDDDLARYMRCTNIQFIRCQKHLREMEKAGIIQVRPGRGMNSGQHCYRVTQEMMKAVETDGVFTPVKMTGLTPEEFFVRLRRFYEAFKCETYDDDRLVEEIDSLVRFNDHLTFCKKVLDSKVYNGCPDTERRIFFYLCHRLVTFGNKSVEIDTLTNFADFLEDADYLKRHIAHELLNIQTSGLVGFAIEDGFVNTEALALTDLVKTEFLAEVELAPEETIRHRDIICTDTIRAKELFFNEAENSQIARLESLLDENNFRQVQKRLMETGMRKGFNAIFYGAPGTGKTASVYELARRSGRDIFRVDMSKLKSKWVGDSEKTVRAVFRMYRALCLSSKKAPIMLFNEADAIFSRRLENVEQSVDQMNNAIQNIILEEMENIEGILIATTNLLNNLDSAFERRFIFKVEFKLPERDSRAKIWRAMIPCLSEDDAAILAEKYSFSGGNIENIARKSTVEYVLSGNEPTLSSLENYCREEILNKKAVRNKIGF